MTFILTFMNYILLLFILYTLVNVNVNITHSKRRVVITMYCKLIYD